MRSLSLFNTLSRKVEPLVPIDPGVVRMYNCGPTVYNFAHIGNLRTFLFQDLLRRTFEASGYEVRFCMNITDVEDKIIRDSQMALPPEASNEARHQAMKALTDRFTQAFLEDLAALGIHPPTAMPRATEYLPRMIAMVETLERKGHAYAREGSVYYRIASLPHYGDLAHLDREGMQSGAGLAGRALPGTQAGGPGGDIASASEQAVPPAQVRMDVDEYERDSAQDFVLWKATRPGEPYWDSPWGPGRPGWHLECSVMGIDVLGERMDLHTGGVDLIFPHHTNEIAQSEGCLGHRWVNHWCHGEFLMVEGQKMSKSLGNFYTLRDLQARGIDPIAFRFAIQSNHYRKLLNFSFEGLRAAEASLARIRAFRRRMEGPGEAGAGEARELIDPMARLEGARQAFWSAMADDLNTPEALAALFTLVTDLNAQDDRAALTAGERQAVLAFLDETNSIYLGWPKEEDALPAEVQALVEARKAARQSRDWAESDRLREALKALGWTVEDRKDGSVQVHRG